MKVKRQIPWKKMKEVVIKEIKDTMKNPDSKMTKKEMAQKYKIGLEFINNTAREYGLNNVANAAANVILSELFIKEQIIENRNIPVLYENPIKAVGLISNRHDMPVDSFIFEESFSSSLMFDYEKQYEICENFILNNIEFNDNVADKTLYVYVTGLQSALGSITKVCFDHKINLAFFHYNYETNEYCKQVIFDSFPRNSLKENEFINNLLMFYGKVYVYGDLDAIMSSNAVYALKIYQYTEDRKTLPYPELHISLSFDTIWNIYREKVDKYVINGINTDRYGLFVGLSKISNDLGEFKMYNIKDISKAYSNSTSSFD